MNIPEELLSRKFGLVVVGLGLFYDAMRDGTIPAVTWAYCTVALLGLYCIGQGLAELHFATVALPTQIVEKITEEKKEG